MEYLDFVIRLSPSGSGWATRVVDSPFGAGHEVHYAGVDLDRWAQLWASQADRVRRPRSLETVEEVTELVDLEQLPGLLFAALFSGETLRLWDRSLAEAAPGGLRLRLQFDDEEVGLAPLLPLPWELIWDPMTETFHGPSSLTPILRYLEVSQPRPRGSLPRPLGVLLIAANPRGLPVLAHEEEVVAIQEAFQGNDSVQIERLRGATIEELDERLRCARRSGAEDGIHILHFIGHGHLDPVSGEGFLLFEDAAGEPHQVSGRMLTSLLKDSRYSLRLAVLNACHSAAQRGGEDRDPCAGVAASLVHGGVPAVVAMQLPISDEAAIAFARSLYQELALGESVEVAVAVGRQAIQRERENTFEWAVPALFSRLREGRLFESARPDLPLAQRLEQLLLQLSGATGDLLERSARQALQGESLANWEPVLAKALAVKATVASAARLITRLRLFTPRMAEALCIAREYDEEPWPVEAALRSIALRDADYLPQTRRSLRRTLLRSPALLESFQRQPGWRRLGAAVYGGLQADGRVDPALFHHEAPMLTGWVLKTLKEEMAPEERLGELGELYRASTENRSDLLLARTALGDHPPVEEVREARFALRRLVDGLEAQEMSVEAWLPALRGQSESVLNQMLARLPKSHTVPAALLKIARSLSVPERLPWLVHFLKRFLQRDDPTALYNLAVVLDTQGSFLSSSPELLAEAVTLALDGVPPASYPRHQLWYCAGLDALASLPEAHGFFVGWVLVCLSPRLQSAGLLPEALALALQLSDRLNAREDTLSRLVAQAAPGTLGPLGIAWLRHPRPTVPLGELAATLDDPWLRFRLTRRVVRGWPATRDFFCRDCLGRGRAWLAPASCAVGEIRQRSERRWATAELRQLQGLEQIPPSKEMHSPMESQGRALLGSNIDESWPSLSPIVLRALAMDALELLDEGQEAIRSTHSLMPLSRLGVSTLHQIAGQWLAHQEGNPQLAVALRRRFQSVEHDDAEALEGWAEIVATDRGSLAREAEVILENIQALRGNLAGILTDLLGCGVPRVRRALLRSITILLARRRLPDSVWAQVAEVLPKLAEDGLVDGEHFVLNGAEAVAAAVGAVRQRLAVTGAALSPVKAAQRSYDRWRRPWPEALAAESPLELRRTLTAIGEEWLVSRRSSREVDAAARRVAMEPQVFDILLDWASQEMRRDVCRRNCDDHLLGDLLSVVSGAASRLRSHYVLRNRALPLWERQLCEAAREADWSPTRRAALELLVLRHERSPQVLATFQEARKDIREVRQVVERLNDGH